MKIPKLLILDIDGTITIRGKGLYLPIMHTLEQLQGQGMLCTFATGRGLFRTQQILGSDFTAYCPLILENGGRITNWSGDDVATYPIDNSALDDLLPLFSADAIGAVDLYQADHRYCVLILNEQQREWVRGFLPPEQIARTFTDVHDFLTHAKSGPCCKLVLINIRADSLVFPDNVNYVLNNGMYIINRKGISKGTAVIELSNYLGIDLDDTVIAGNDDNDLDMFATSARWKIAVGDTCPALDNFATHHVDSPVELDDFLRTFLR